ncbi:hypothetical protein [Paenibacillus sp. BIC5C1]|uniref:hypothetical protein n=1 Tax=Paenibacillus sp. BIC5C1 TaxID=3078263 RepID=UPI0028EF79A1|nr:hypothetical protein [Paenibacillus sp. BIC5C1]
MKSVGFDQKIKLLNLDLIVKKIQINDGENIYSNLDKSLRDDIKGNISRRKVMTLLMKIWGFSDYRIEGLRELIVEKLPFLTKYEQICAHYCMSCLAYPFFAEQMMIVYKNLKLSDIVHSKLIMKEMKNIYGDRRRVEVAAGAVFSSAKDWGIINMPKSGSYKSFSKQFLISNPIIKYLIIETYMQIHETSSVSLESINNSAIFYPFDYDISIGDIRHSRFTIVRNIRDILIERNSRIPYSI